jgi:FkbM family methyltransferase
VLNAEGLELPLKLSAAVMAVSAFNAIQQGVLAGLEDFKGIAYLNIVRGGVAVPATIAGAMLGGVEGILVGNFIAGALTVFIGHGLISKALQVAGIRIDTSDLAEERRALLGFSLPTILSSAVIMAATWFATVVLVRGPDGFIEMGIFNAANQWYMAILFVPTLITRPALSMLSQAWRGSLHEFRAILVANLTLTAVTSGIAATVVLCGSSYIMAGYGGGFHSGAIVLEILAIAAIFSAISGVVGSAIWSAGRMWHSLGVNALWSVVFCSACLGFRHFGALGIAMAYLTAYAVHSLVLGLYAKSLLQGSGAAGAEPNRLFQHTNERHMFKRALYKYGNGICRKVMTWPLKTSLVRSRAEYITRKIQLSDKIEFLMTLCLADRGLSRQLLTNDWREYDSTKFFIENFVGRREVVLDIGANLGYFALIEASISRENRVYAIEPVPDNFKLLRANVDLNAFTNVSVHNCGISSRTEIREMVVPRHRNWATLNTQLFAQLERSAGGATRVNVPLMSLFDFVKANVPDRPTMLRMDVEGFEYDILIGNIDFVRTHRPKLFLEFHSNLLGKSRSIELIDHLLALGYELDRWIMNAEYCGKELIFTPPPGMRVWRTISLAEYRAELVASTNEQVASRDGCMLFLRCNDGSGSQ